MKKRTLPLLMLLAGLSVAALAACDEHEHTYSWKNSEDGATHWQECECGDKINEGAHVDADANGKCDSCDANLHVHNYVLTHDAENHWLQCSCGDKKDVTAHADVKNNDDPTNETPDFKCDDCGAHVHHDLVNNDDHAVETPDAKCDDCGEHVHLFTFEQDATKHWQICGCGFKTDGEAHFDKKNNESGIAYSDGKCDDCGRESTVRFAMKGHGVAPNNLYVAVGEKATAPENPADDDAFKFGGWYKDAACTVPFDFETETINAITTVFAKWTEDETVGASKKHAYELSMTETDNLKPVENGKAIIYKFTAESSGRYTVSLGGGTNSQNCTFTTSLSGDTVYGTDQEFNFDMEAEEEIYVSLTFHGTDGDGIRAGVVLSETLNEPLPEDYFLDGEYTDGGYISLVLSRKTGKINYFGQPYNFSYIGGKFDRIQFDMDAGRMYLIHKEDGSYEFKDSKGNMDPKILNRFVVPETLVDFSKLVGYYEAEGDVGDGITELYIYASEDDPESDTVSTNVLYQQGGQYQSGTASYDKTKNKFYLPDSSVVTLNLDGSNVASIQIGNNSYTRKKAELGSYAENIPLTGDAPEYYGTSHAIRVVGDSQFFGATGNDGITVIEVVDDKYTIAVKKGSGFETYQLTVTDEKTITLYEVGNATPIDTLTLLEYKVTDKLPCGTEESPNQSVTVAENDFQKGTVGIVRIYTVETAGWYQFTVPEGVEIYCGLTAFNNYAKDNGKLVGAEAVKLTAGSLVCVFVETAAETTINYKAPSTPADGWDGGKAKELVNGTATVQDITEGTYTFKCIAPAAGKYQLHVYFDDALKVGDAIKIKINDGTTETAATIDYGNDEVNQRFIPITATAANQAITVSVTMGGDNGNSLVGHDSITVAVVEDYTTGATELTLTSSGEGDGDSRTLTATAQAGNSYHFKTTNGKEVTATATAAFTVKTQNGINLSATKSGETYTATIPAAEKLYFTIVSDTADLPVTLSQTFAKGSSETYPLAVTTTVTIEQTKTVYFTLSAGAYRFSATESVSIYKVEKEEEKADTLIRAGEIFTVKEGDVFYCPYYNGEELTATLTFETLTTVFTEEQVKYFKGKTVFDEITVALKIKDAYGTVIYTVGNANYTLFAVKDGDAYTFAYGGSGKIRVSFTFNADGTALQVIDDSLDSGSAFTIEQASESSTYKREDQYVGTYTLFLNGDMTSGTYKLDDGYGGFEYSIEIESIGDNEYQFTYGDDWMSTTVTFTIEGNKLTLVEYDTPYEFTLQQ